MDVGNVAALLAMAAVMAYTASVRKKINDRGGCPNCNMPVPAIRFPTSVRQFLWGGWTCAKCETEMDKHGFELVTARSESQR